MSKHKKKPPRSLAASIAASATYAGAFLWEGWPGLVIALVSGVVMSAGTLRNAYLSGNLRRLRHVDN